MSNSLQFVLPAFFQVYYKSIIRVPFDFLEQRQRSAFVVDVLKSLAVVFFVQSVSFE